MRISASGRALGGWNPARGFFRAALLIGLALAPLRAQAAALDDSDTARLADMITAVKSFEDDVSAALHDLPTNDAEEIESYAYVELNLESAHERLNTVFMLTAVSGYVESASDQLLILNLMYGQLLPQSKRYLTEKKNAIASMAAAHPANEVLAGYSSRAVAVLGDKAVPLLDEFYRKIGETQQ